MKAIMYHYVRPDDPAFPHFRHLRVRAFEEQLDFFERRHGFLTRDEFLQTIETGTSPKPGVVLTFDDGLKDHFDYVFPALRRRGLFGIFYIPAYPYLRGRMLDVHRAHLLLGRCGGHTIWEALRPQISDRMLSHAHVRDFQQQTYRTQSNDDPTNLVKRTLNYFIDYQFRTKIVDALMSEFFPDEAEIGAGFYLSETEMRQMHAAGMILGSHTVNHPCLSKLTVEDQAAEISQSFDFLEKVLGQIRPKTFCYPYGGFHSFTRETERLLENAGCHFSFNVEPRDVSTADLLSRRQALPRYECNLFPPIKTS